ncbi:MULTISPECIES: hypothetical protein [Streptomyces]|uniref:hypothetical protein n=1 Tax=Streptomyces TaxID=1883 RepID=UPI00117FED22|nr:hypothetical protein [Streptomyces kasugaensis]
MRANLSLEPLKVSTLPFHHLQLRDGERRAIVCPDCQEWHPIRRGVIWPHRLERTERATNGHKCPGSARRVDIDVNIAAWGRAMAEATASVAGRRPNRVLRKPKTPPVPAVSQMQLGRLTAETALTAYRTHRQQCALCTGRSNCATGTRLAATHARMQRQERTARLQAVQRADAQRMQGTQDAVAPLRRPDVPLEPVQLTT